MPFSSFLTPTSVAQRSEECAAFFEVMTLERTNIGAVD